MSNTNINQAIVQALRETRNCGSPISAIKRIREITGLGLGESKVVFEYATKRKVGDGLNHEGAVLSVILGNMMEEALLDAAASQQDEELALMGKMYDMLKGRSVNSVKRILLYLMERLGY